METNFREMLNTGKLKDFVGKESFNVKEKKASRNIKYCANDQWQFVNSWYDQRDEDARAYMMDARQLFDRIYQESLVNVYDESSVHFGTAAEAYLKDVRFCGKEFLQKVTFYYVAMLLEESVEEVEGTEEDAQKVLADLKNLQKELFGISDEDVSYDDMAAHFAYICDDVKSGNNLIECIAMYLGTPVKFTKKNEEWIPLQKNVAVLLSQYLIAKESKLERRDTRSKIIFSNENVELTLNLGTNPYIWNTKGN